MNILFVLYSPLGVGGAEVSTLSLARQLKAKGHNVYIASTGDYPGIPSFRFFNYRKIPFYSIHNFYLKNFLKRIIAENNIQIVNAQDRLTSIPAIRAAKECGIHSIVHIRDHWFACPKSSCIRKDLKECDACSITDLAKCTQWYRFPWDLYKLAYLKKCRRILKQADAKITVGSAIKSKLSKFGITENVYIIHNSRDPPKAIKKIKKPKGRIYVTYFGSLSYIKGIQNIVKVMKNIVRKNKNVDFLLVGDGPMMSDIKDFVSKNNMDGRFKFFGWVPHDKVWSLYSATDIVVFPSIVSESFGSIAVEAMFTSKPIVASNKGGILDIVENGKTGFLVAPFDLEKWEQKIQLLIDKADLRRDMGRKGKTRSKLFTSEYIASQVEALYKKVIKK